MTRTKPVVRKCGTCRFWPGNPRSPSSERCAYPVPDVIFPPLPEAITFGNSGYIPGVKWPPPKSHVDRTEGTKCPVWEARAPPPATGSDEEVEA